MQDFRLAVARELPRGDVREVLVVASRLSVGCLALLTKMGSAGLCAVKRLGAHELGELEAVGNASRPFEAWLSQSTPSSGWVSLSWPTDPRPPRRPRDVLRAARHHVVSRRAHGRVRTLRRHHRGRRAIGKMRATMEGGCFRIWMVTAARGARTNDLTVAKCLSCPKLRWSTPARAPSMPRILRNSDASAESAEQGVTRNFVGVMTWLSHWGTNLANLTAMPIPSESLWISTRKTERFPRLDKDIHVDVAVVGAGITGITAAMLLTEAGKRVALIEGRRVLEGETGHTTAHLTEAIDARYTALKANFGEGGARLAYEASRAAVAQIRASVRTLGIDCGLETLPGYLYTERDRDLHELHVEFESARALGIPVEMTRNAPLPFPTLAAIRYDDQAQIQPRRYLAPMLDILAKRGCQIFENTHVTDFEDGSPCTIAIADGAGAQVTADSIVLATNAPLNRLLLQTKLAHYRTYAAAFLYEGNVENALFWDTEDPYHYTRSTVLDGKLYLIVGGEDHKTGQNDDTDASFDRLIEYARGHFGVEAPTYRWSGQIVEPVDGLPYIGRNSASTNVYVATGFGGNGMTFGTLAGMLLSDLILDRPNPYRGLFDATRIKPIASAGDFVRENADFPAHFVGDRLRRVEGTLADLACNEGQVLRLDGESVAVYRDAHGVPHGLSPVCTHLGCHVKFNRAEKTWDCPCHGSRFDTEGQVINGPALTALSKKQIALSDLPQSEESRPS